jgi:hypothetical protein
MKRTLKLKWDAFKKGIPCNVSCRNESYLSLLKLKKPIHASCYVKKNLQKPTSPTEANKNFVKKVI